MQTTYATGSDPPHTVVGESERRTTMAATYNAKADAKVARLAQLANDFVAEVDETGLPLTPRAKAIQTEFHALWDERFPESN